MIRFLRNISLALLASLYLVASFGTMIYQVAMPCVSSGLEKVEAATRSTKEHPKQVWTQRRHMPMVKEVSTSPLIPVKVNLHHDIKQYTSVRFDDPLFLISAFYFSSLSDRAPPLS